MRRRYRRATLRPISSTKFDALHDPIRGKTCSRDQKRAREWVSAGGTHLVDLSEIGRREGQLGANFHFSQQLTAKPVCSAVFHALHDQIGKKCWC